MAQTADRDDDDGIVFPVGRDGRRSSSETGRAIFADALRAVNPAAAARVDRERNWRARYLVHARRLVEEAAASPAAADAIAAAGLRSAHHRLQFARDGVVRTLEAALSHPRGRLHTHSVAGISKAAPAPVAVPYRGQLLSGDALRRQLDRWEADGVLESSFAQALWRVQANPGWLDLSDQRFALLGACAEMGPLPYLLRWRARVYAVDLPRADLWQRMLRLAHAGNGVLCVPCAAPPPSEAEVAQCAGADLVRDTPEIVAWLQTVDGPLAIGAYAYLDGAQHVRVAAAMDAIQAAIAAQRADTTLAMLATPTDAYAVPAVALRAAHERYARRGCVARAAHAATLGRAFARNGAPLPAHRRTDDAEALAGIVDALIAQQGPNYVLAKRLQHWRALAARGAGVRVSIHVAPPALTRSVTNNRLLAAAYRAAHRFGAEAFEPSTAAALMAALLVHDLRHPQAAANPNVALAHPLQLLAEAACHGGLWRMPYAARSALPAAAIIGLLRG
ncbi:MAG: hypothetical protein OHK0044_33120 [Burkholderiaceae bacterium]